MTLLHGAVRFRDDDPGMGLDGLVLRLAVDRYRYRAPGETDHGDPVTPTRETVGEVVEEFDLPAVGGRVEMRVPGRAVVGDDLSALVGWAQTGNWDDLTVGIRYAVGDPERTLLASGTWEAYLNVDDHAGDGGPNDTREAPSGIDEVARQVFLVDAAAYRRFLARHPAQPGRSDRYGLDLLRRLGVFTSTVVRLEAFSDDDLRGLAEREKVDEEVVKDLVRNWADLTTFTVTLEPLVAVEAGGQFTVVSADPVAAQRLGHYRLTGGLTVATVDGRRRAVELDPHYGEVEDPLAFPLPFALTTPSSLATVSARGAVAVRVRGVDGSDLWSDAFDVDDPDLRSLDIEVPAVTPGTDLVPSGGATPAGTTDHRLRGQVVHASGEATPPGLTIVVQAKESEDDAVWQLVAAGSTEAGGYFSMPYPTGAFARAQALVSVAPDDVVDLRMVEGARPDETIADDFVYLLLTRSTEGGEAGGRPARLPGQADLIRSGQYSQDLGGCCMNITTPNRTLREYRYHGVVRTSDPDVANYTLRKDRDGTFVLSGGAGTLERGPVDLNNPIRWMDAPEAGDHLSFYQAVSVATGHILYYRSVLKADGYSLGDLVYTLPLAPGQKKQIVSYDMANTLELAESQRVSQGETLAAGLQDDRTISDELSGGLAESMAGSSSAHTSGMSAGLGAAGGFGPISGSLGVSGGFANSSSEASQNGSRNISQAFGETLRQSLLQRAESYRELNASVVKTVRDGEEYAVTTEVVANHNHCHSLTMMYFEVLRHYAVSQELAEVRECLFVPLLLTEFVPDNVARFKDVLATNLLAVPSTTYGRSIFSMLTARRHPLLRAFDANDRIRTGYTRVDYPTASYAEDPITSITGEMRLRTDIPRPRTRADRVMSLPIVTQVIHSKVTDTKATVAAAIFSGGLSLLFGDATRTVSEEVLVKEKIFDQFLTLDDNFQTVPPARAIRVTSFEPQTVVVDGVSTTLGFFQNPEDERQWQAYADLLGFAQAWRLLEAYFAGNLISEWDEIFRRDIAPRVFDRIIDSIGFTAVGAGDGLNLDLTPTTQYRGGERAMTIRLAGGGHRARNQLAPELRLRTNSARVHDLTGIVTLTVEKISLDYATAHFRGPIYRGYAGNDLLDSAFATSGVLLPIPLTARDKVNPRTEDQYLVGELLDHLNAHIEHYNRALWTGLDENRRYMLLDGFSIETYTRDGTSGGLRSLASVVKNELVTVAGNSLVFPVAEGYHVDQSLVAPVEAEEGESAPDRAAALHDRYLPLREVEPYRLSVPTRGVYAEAVLGECDACEDVKPNSSQDWTKFTTDEPTAISAVTTPTPGPADWRTVWAQFANPLVALQTPRELPAPGAGLAGLSDALTKSDSFANITGLTENQKNAMATYQSNQENARAFAEMAKGMALQEMNSSNSRSIMEDLREANQSGALSDDDYQRMVRDHLGQRIDGGERQRTETEAAESSRPSLTNAAIEAARTGRDVEAHRTETDGTTESVRVSTSDTSRAWIILDPGLDAQARAFHPRARDITGRTTLTVSVPDLPEGGIVRWSIPAGSEGHYTLPGGAARFDGTSVTLEAARSGRADIDVAVIDAGGAVIESQKLALCVPQFVDIRSAAAFTTVLTGTFGLIAEEIPDVLEEAKEVCDLILATANVRTVWTMAPFSQQLPAHLRVGPGAALVTHATLEGDPPRSGLLGQTRSVAGGIGPADADEQITVWPGAYDDDVVGNPAEFLDDATRAVIRTITGEAGMSSTRKLRAMSVLGRLLGETLAHEVVHSLIGRTLSGGFHHASPGLEHALMNQGSDRTFEGRTGFELTAPASTADIVDDLVDQGIGVINIPVQESQHELDTHVPVPPAFH